MDIVTLFLDEKTQSHKCFRSLQSPMETEGKTRPASRILSYFLCKIRARKSHQLLFAEAYMLHELPQDLSLCSAQIGDFFSLPTFSEDIRNKPI